MLFVVLPQRKVFSPNQVDLHTPKSRHKGCIQRFCLIRSLGNLVTLSFLLNFLLKQKQVKPKGQTVVSTREGTGNLSEQPKKSSVFSIFIMLSMKDKILY